MKIPLEQIAKDTKNNNLTESQVNFWFDVFNEVFFKSRLRPFDEITFSSFEDSWGWCMQAEDDENYFSLLLHWEMPFYIFLAVLGHEMVHLWQGQIQKVKCWYEPEESDFDETFQIFNEDFLKHNINIINIYENY